MTYPQFIHTVLKAVALVQCKYSSLVEIPGIEPGLQQPAPSLLCFVDLARIELAPPQCECGILPLYYKPKV